MTYTQAGIAVDNQQVFGELKAAIDAVFAPQAVDKFLRSMEKSNLRIRDFAGVLQKGLLPQALAEQLFSSLGTADQAQLREHYLTKLEQVEPAIRSKFKKLYSYY
ncbi:MAG TPA: hypothetical protein VK738_19065 [Terriglobales bacterium]|jgi:hypothetical protein|nr:hypothetical protein [Terriglobales bacterium]